MMTMNLYEKICALFPDLTDADWQYIQLRNDGAGDYIAAWDHPDLAQPAPADLEAAVRRISSRAVIAERARRLALGFDYNFGDGRGVHHFATTDEDMKGWDEVSKASLAALALGTAETLLHIVTDTGPVTVTALEWQQVISVATGARQGIWQASFLLQQMNPIPADYADDSYWAQSPA